MGRAALLVVEHAPGGEARFLWQLAPDGVVGGLLIATGLFTAVSSLPEEQFLSLGLAVPFLLSIVLVAVGLVIRLKIAETPAFERGRTGTEARMPLVDAVAPIPRACCWS